MVKQSTSYIHLIGRELAAALGVLALVFLSFSHQPIDPSSGQIFRLADGSVPVFCGSVPIGGEQSDRNECDACRLSFGLKLPDAACSVSEIFVQAERVTATADIVAQPQGLTDRVGDPRAPPFARIFS